MTTILVTGTTSLARLAKLLDASIDRLGMTDLAVVAGDPADPMVTAWNARRYRLTRWWAAPVADVALVFGDAEDPDGVGRVIRC